MTQNLLQGEHVAPVPQISDGEGVAKGMRGAPYPVVVQGKCQGSLFSDSVSVPPRHRYFQLMAIHTSSGPAVAD
jgi:hypothetical protein